MYKVLGSLFGLIVFIYIFFHVELSPFSQSMEILAILAIAWSLYTNIKNYYVQNKS